MSGPTLTCYGGVGTVTGANFLLQTKTKKVLVDCGMFQGVTDDKMVRTFEYDPTQIDFLFITHAHTDHIGRIPDIIEAGFKGVIYSTPETKEISALMLADQLHISSGNPELKDRAMSLWQTLNYHEPKDFADFTLELFNSGHILGSAMYKFTFPSGRSILFTGDLGNSPSPLLPNAEEVHGLSYLLMDSVYGDRNHQPKDKRDAQFVQVLQDVIARKSTLLIPTFSLERTQIMLHDFDKLFDAHTIQNLPVFLDSPLAIKITEIYRRDLGKGRDDFDFDRLKETAQVRDSYEIDSVPGPKVILAGSGMSTAGRILHHEEKYLPDPNATILFIGYQAVGTLGRQIADGVKEVEINGNKIKVNAKVVSIEGFSAHADSDQLVHFVSESKDTLKEVFITMGEPKSSIFLSQRLNDELGVKSVIPEQGREYELDL